MTDPIALVTAAGPVRLRAEQADDHAFLSALFRSHMGLELAGLPVDAATREALLGMQFNAQTLTYRGNFPHARFDIVEAEDRPIGRLVVDSGGDTGCIVDFALMPDWQRRGLGSAILAAMLERFVPLGRPVRCKVLMHNQASVRMCHRVGFQQISQNPPFLQLEWRPDIQGSDRDT